MELVIDSLLLNTPWAIPVLPVDEPPSGQNVLVGREYFSKLGIVRRKPGECKYEKNKAQK
jgi:hypothetical protein